MRTLLFASLLLMLGVSPFNDTSASTTPTVVINEIQISGGTDHANDDFIELYNPAAQDINVTGWKLKKRIKSGTESTIYNFEVADDEKLIVPARGYFLWANKDGIFTGDPLLIFTSSATLSDNYSLALFDEKSGLVDSLTYGSGHANPYSPSIIYPANPNPPKATLADPNPKMSLERDLPNNIFILQNNPTPENNAFIEKQKVEQAPEEKSDSEDLPDQATTVRINEIFPDPKEKGEAGEFVELFNFGTQDLDLAGFVLRDASKTGEYVFPSPTILPPGEYFAIDKGTSKLSLNNSEESVSLFDPKENLIDSIEYEKTKEGASFGFDGNSFRWSKHVTQGEANEFDSLPESKTDIPTKAYRNTVADFSAKGSATHKFTWDFGDGTKSYKQETTHTYKEKGDFKGSLTVDNGFEETKKYFTVKVKKFPKQNVSIVEIAANPEGADSESEYLVLKNTGKKKINLADWSIATGTQAKKLTNHPIAESFLLKKGETKKINSVFSSFSLPNQSGFIELRQPDGKVAQKISYRKTAGVDENEIYALQPDKKWAWTQAAAKADTNLSEDGNNLIPEEAAAGENDVSLRDIRLEDLAPDQKALLEAEVEKKLREKILAEVRAQMNLPENQISPDQDEAQADASLVTPAPNNSPEELSKKDVLEPSPAAYPSFKKLMGVVFLRTNASINELLLEPNEI